MKVLHDTKADGWFFTRACRGCLSDLQIEADDVTAYRDQFLDEEFISFEWKCVCCGYSNGIGARSCPDWVLQEAIAKMPAEPPKVTALSWFSKLCIRIFR
jgi:hypothetical protein